MRLTLRTLLAYLDDTLPSDEAKTIGQKVVESPAAQELIEKIKIVTRRRGLSTPPNDRGSGSDPNTVAEYLSDALKASALTEFENLCLESDVHLAEVAACHQILTLLLSEPVRVPPTARQRMYRLVSGPESLPNKKPGNTVPIGGVAPDEPVPGSEDADAAYLLGMKAYGRTDSRNQRLGQFLLLSGLIVGLILTTYAAWPVAERSPYSPRRVDLAVAIPKINRPDEKQPEQEIPQPEPPAVPMPPAVEPMFVDSSVVVPPPVTVRPPVDLLPNPQPPKNDPVNVSRFELSDRILLVKHDQKWLRILPKMPEVATGEQLLALPGYHIPITLDSGIQLELWGNLPEHNPVPLLESSVTLHMPYDGFDADMTLHAGRIYLSNKKPTSTVARVRFGEEIWDVTFLDAATEVVIESTRRIIPGMTVEVDPSEKPQTTLQLAVLKGTARLKTRYKDLPPLLVGDSVIWTNKGVGLQGPKKLAKTEVFAKSHAIATDPIYRATQASLQELSDGVKEPDSIRVRLAEMFVYREPGFNETPMETNRRLVKPAIAVLAYAAIGELSPVVDALVDESRPRVRDAGAYGLQSLAAASANAIENIATTVRDKSRLTAEQTRMITKLLRGPSPTERTNPVALDTLVDSLSSPVLAIRELAYWQLLNEVDPEARMVKVLTAFDAASPALAREGSVNAWKRRIEDLKKKNAER